MNDDLENETPEEESFADLFESYSAGMNDNIRVGDRIRGRIISMGATSVFVDTGTKVDGVYDKDPKKHADAKRYDTISYDDVLQQHLGVMDASAIALARDNNLPIIVFSLDEPGGFRGILAGAGTFTIVS
mgnify:CR=1 FL=1